MNAPKCPKCGAPNAVSSAAPPSIPTIPGPPKPAAPAAPGASAPVAAAAAPVAAATAPAAVHVEETAAEEKPLAVPQVGGRIRVPKGSSSEIASNAPEAPTGPGFTEAPDISNTGNYFIDAHYNNG